MWTPSSHFKHILHENTSIRFLSSNFQGKSFRELLSVASLCESYYTFPPQVFVFCFCELCNLFLIKLLKAEKQHFKNLYLPKEQYWNSQQHKMLYKQTHFQDIVSKHNFLYKGVNIDRAVTGLKLSFVKFARLKMLTFRLISGKFESLVQKLSESPVWKVIELKSGHERNREGLEKRKRLGRRTLGRTKEDLRKDLGGTLGRTLGKP